MTKKAKAKTKAKAKEASLSHSSAMDILTITNSETGQTHSMSICFEGLCASCSICSLPAGCRPRSLFNDSTVVTCTQYKKEK